MNNNIIDTKYYSNDIISLLYFDSDNTTIVTCKKSRTPVHRTRLNTCN